MPDSTEQTAREMGWRPREEFRGDEAKWVDAETYISRGENFIPILRKTRDEARADAALLKAQLAETKAAVEEYRVSLEELKRFHGEDTARQVKLARESLIRQLREARESGDVESEVSIQDALAQTRVTESPPKPAAAPPAPAPAPAAELDPTFVAWQAKNDWFQSKPRLRGLALGIAAELKESQPNLVGTAFYAKLDEEMADYLQEGGASPRPSSKVAGGRPSGNSGGGRVTREPSYADLPADAKQACDSYAAKLVGPNKAYKTLAEWQTAYAKTYADGETA